MTPAPCARTNTPTEPAQRFDALGLGPIVGLLALAALAWALTAEKMAGMDEGPGTDLGSLSFYVSAWVLMMAAMMFPSIAPMVRAFALMARNRNAGRGLGTPALEITAFVGGYLLTWTAFGLVAYTAFELIRSFDVPAFSWDEGGPYLAGALILAAGLYQLTSLKDACLSGCRSPHEFFTERWRDGAAGALRLGLEHGAWCVGCCWALMVVLFALGVMSMGWMVFVAALIAVEKLLPWRAAANHGIALLLVLLGLSVAFVPERVPGLVIPGSTSETKAMKMMGDAGHTPQLAYSSWRRIHNGSVALSPRPFGVRSSRP